RKLEEAKAKAQERLKVRPLPPGAAEFLKQLESGAFGVNTTPEMGIRLLALDLKQTSRLFLWWD
ncbi:MAG TPA: hypothetical protein VHB99_16950, partial [Pirellulales bacterium]|nr:hypothetical protein [Pirellulales bacterium]